MVLGVNRTACRCNSRVKATAYENKRQSDRAVLLQSSPPGPIPAVSRFKINGLLIVPSANICPAGVENPSNTCCTRQFGAGDNYNREMLYGNPDRERSGLTFDSGLAVIVEKK